MSGATIPSVAVAPAELRDLVRAAVLAPSPRNTQPWKFRVECPRIDIFADFARRLPVSDPADAELHVALGCAIENMVVLGEARGLAIGVAYTEPWLAAPPGPESDVARVAELWVDRDPRTPSDEPLARAIAQRQTTRRRYARRLLQQAELRALAQAAEEEGVRFQLFTTRPDRGRLAEYVAEGMRRQFGDEEFVREHADWMRFNLDEKERKDDGMWVASLGLPPAPAAIGRALVRRLASPDTQARSALKLVRNSPALAVFAAEHDAPRDWLAVGRAFERFALRATALGLRYAPVSQPCEVPEVRTALAAALGLGAARPLMVVRLGYARPMPRAPRRALDDVLIR